MATDAQYSGRVSVPVLWDKQTRQIVNNSEDDISRTFNGVFSPLGDGAIDLFPADFAAEQDRLSAFLYENVNSGVYQAGFATTQAAYEKAVQARLALGLEPLVCDGVGQADRVPKADTVDVQRVGFRFVHPERAFQIALRISARRRATPGYRWIPEC